VTGKSSHPGPVSAGAFLFVAMLVSPAYGGDEPRVLLEPRGTAASLALSHATIRVDTSLVLIPVTVTDPKNRAVVGLDRETFRVFDGKTEQQVTHFSQDDAPLTVGIVFDSSGSMRDKLGKSREAVAQFFKTANPEDEFFLVECSDRARLTVPFTDNANDIQGRLLTTESRGKTPLLDAVYMATQYMKKARNSRRALLVISDGGDNDSRFTAAELRSLVREADVWIYSIGIYGRTPMLPEQEPSGQHLLATLAEDTGGREFALQDVRELPEVAQKIGLELRNQYILGFTPASEDRDGKYHRVQVKLVQGKNLHVSARPGYFAPQ
jgi:Ca-activated chloride channel family protein